MIPLEQTLKKENEKKKAYLRGYRRHGKRIKRIEAEIEEIRSMKMYPSTKSDGMPKASGSTGDLSSYAAELLEKENELYYEGVEQVKTFKDISYKIKQLEDEDERDVLFYRYIKGMEWWEIARNMDFSESWVHELHGRALKKIQSS